MTFKGVKTVISRYYAQCVRF